MVQDHPSGARFPDSEAYAAESIAEMAHRVVAAVRARDAAVEAEHGPGAMWVAVTHGDAIKAVLADAAGAHLDHFQRIQAGPASVRSSATPSAAPSSSPATTTGHHLARFVPPPEGRRALRRRATRSWAATRVRVDR